MFFCLRGQFWGSFPLRAEPNGPGENSESTQPSPLLFGKTPGPDLDAFEGVFGRAAALEVIHNLPVPKGFPGLATEAIGVVKSPNFIDEAIGGHGLHACVDAAVDGLHGPIEADGHKIFARRPVPSAGGGAAAFGGCPSCMVIERPGGSAYSQLTAPC